MDRRDISERQRRWLNDELQQWLTAGLLAPQQAQAIRDCYESTTDASRRRQGLLITTIMAVAAVLVGLALFLLVSFNWDMLGREAKLAIIFSVILVLHLGGIYLRFARQSIGLSNVVFLLAAISYGAGIWLVAQVFHIDSHYPDGMWWWALGVLPMALVLDSLLLHALLVGLLGTWVGMELIEFQHLPARLLGWAWVIPNGAYSLTIFAALGLAWAYRRGSTVGVGLYALLIGWWVIMLNVAWGAELITVHAVGVIGAVYLLASASHRRGSLLADPWRVLGVVMLGGALMPLSFYAFRDEIDYWWAGRGVVYQFYFTAVYVVALLVAVFIAAQRVDTSQGSGAGQRWAQLWRRDGWVVFLGGCVLLITFLDAMQLAFPHAQTIRGATTVIANVAMVLLALGLMRVGVREDRLRPFAAGVVYFLAWAIMRYVDLFADVGGMLGAALMFFLCGAALFGLGLFWQRRPEVGHG